MENIEKYIKKYLDGTATPEEIQIVEEYYTSFSGIDNFTDRLTSIERKILEEKILSNIQSQIHVPKTKPGKVKTLWSSIPLMPVAASLAGLLILSFIYVLQFSGRTVRIKTEYGEVKTHRLPDNSLVTLNGNSLLEYNEWDEGAVRSVNLQGEAYFSVTHTTTNQKFIVHLVNNTQIEVLGTEFNVTTRKDHGRVVLNSGKVKLNLAARSGSSITMRPGEMIEFNDGVDQVITSQVNVEQYSSWKNHKLIFKNTSLKEIVRILEDTYGYHVTVDDNELLHETFTGTIPGNDVDMLLLGLSRLDLIMVKKGNQITIKSK